MARVRKLPAVFIADGKKFSQWVYAITPIDEDADALSTAMRQLKGSLDAYMDTLPRKRGAYRFDYDGPKEAINNDPFMRGYKVYVITARVHRVAEGVR